MEHPRLYWNVHCTPNTEWLRLTPIEVPTDRVWTAKDDARYLSPWIGLPGYRHTVGIARHWHFLSVLFWVGNGLIFVVLLFGTGQWRRLVPASWSVVPDAWAVFVHYATFHLPPEPNGFYRYNALQQLSYFAVVFLLAPLAILTGPSMSPALTNRFRWYPKLPGNRQIGRSLHFLIMCAFVVFLIGHVTMVALTGFARNMNHIVLGTDDTRAARACIWVWWGSAWSWRSMPWPTGRRGGIPGRFSMPPGRSSRRSWSSCSIAPPRSRSSAARISRPSLWPNGKVPTSDEWKALAADDFRDYRLKVSGLVENPVELSLDEIRALGKQTQITLHHCIQGWSGIAEWGGLPMAKLIDLVRPKPEARVAVFYSFGEGLEGGRYYDSHSLANLMHPQTLLAYEMNGEPLGSSTGRPCGCGSRTNSASRWSSGSGRSSSSRATSRSAKGKADTTRTTSTSASWPTSEAGTDRPPPCSQGGGDVFTTRDGPSREHRPWTLCRGTTHVLSLWFQDGSTQEARGDLRQRGATARLRALGDPVRTRWCPPVREGELRWPVATITATPASL